jgi:hypothetical protein
MTTTAQTNQLRADITRLHGQNFNDEAISAKLGLSQSHINRIRRKLELPTIRTHSPRTQPRKSPTKKTGRGKDMVVSNNTPGTKAYNDKLVILRAAQIRGQEKAKTRGWISKFQT